MTPLAHPSQLIPWLLAGLVLYGFYIILVLLPFFALETIVCYAALQKQRNPWAWGSLTFLIGPLALVVAILEPAPFLSGVSCTWSRAMLTALGIDCALIGALLSLIPVGHWAPRRLWPGALLRRWPHGLCAW